MTTNSIRVFALLCITCVLGCSKKVEPSLLQDGRRQIELGEIEITESPEWTLASDKAISFSLTQEELVMIQLTVRSSIGLDDITAITCVYMIQNSRGVSLDSGLMRFEKGEGSLVGKGKLKGPRTTGEFEFVMWFASHEESKLKGSVTVMK